MFLFFSFFSVLFREALCLLSSTASVCPPSRASLLCIRLARNSSFSSSRASHCGRQDWSGERVGDERIVRRLLRIKENQHDKYVSLYMDGTGITEIPVEIWKFEKLEELWASYNKITTLPEEITWLIHLKNLRLESNR